MKRYLISIKEEADLEKIEQQINTLEGVKVEQALGGINILLVSATEASAKSKISKVKGVASVEDEGEVSTQ